MKTCSILAKPATSLSCRNASDVARHLQARDAVGLAHADDLVGGQGSGAHSALMAATMDLRLDPDSV